MSMIFRTVQIPDMPIDTDVPPATTRDKVGAEELDAAESEAENDEEHIGVDEEATYEGLTEVEEAMVDSAVHISLAEKPMVDPSGAGTADVTPGTDAPQNGETV
uniref:Polyprotein protein n=1 Tax=Solanum tuberosum TaxID=4113 RepID=M1DKS5_SOLTU